MGQDDLLEKSRFELNWEELFETIEIVKNKVNPSANFSHLQIPCQIELQRDAQDINVAYMSYEIDFFVDGLIS